MDPDLSLFKKFKTVGKHGILYGTGSVARQLAAIVLIPLYTRVLTSADYGMLGLIIITGQIAGTVFALGLRSGLLRSFYDYTEDAPRKVVISTVLFLTAANSIILFLCGLLFCGYLSAQLFGSREYRFYIILIISSAVLDMFNQIVFAVFRARQKPGKFISLQMLFFLIKVCVIIYLVAIKGWAVKGVLVGQLTANGIAAFVLFWSVRNYIVPKFSLFEAHKMIRYGAPLVLVGIFGFVSTYIDRYILNFYVNLNKVGLYTLAYQLGMLMVVLLVTPVKQVWGPIFLSVKDHYNFEKFCAKSLTYLVVIGGFVFLPIALLSKELLYIMSSPEYWDAYTVIPIIAFTYLIWSTRSVLEVGILLKRRTMAIASYTLMGAAINIFLNIILIPRYGMTGAACATLVSFTATIIVDYIYNRRLFKIEYEWRRIAKAYIAIGIIFSAGYFYIIDNIYLSIAFKAVIIMLYPFLLLLLGFYENQEIARAKEVIHAVVKSFRRTS